MNTKLFYAIGLISASLLGLEIVWTRILSAEFYHTFAFLIISLAILGISFGSLSLRIFRRANGARVAAAFGVLSAGLAIASPILVLRLGLHFNDLFAGYTNLWKLAAAILLLLAPFFCAGVVISRLFKMAGPAFPRLYACDLAGASMGAIAAVGLMNAFGVPAAALLLVVPLVIGVLLLESRIKYLSVVGLAAIVGLLYFAWSLYLPPRTERAPIKHRHWDSMGLIKVYADSENAYGINIDNVANTPAIHFDGNFNKPEKPGFAINLQPLIQRRPDCHFLSVGAGGGGDVLQALTHGATEVCAVEVMPKINQMLTAGELREFTGNLYHDPRVKVFTEDARIFTRNQRNRFDLIFSLSSNTFAALGSGAFAMAESYLFTKEAFMDYYRALSDHGIMVMEHQFYIPRVFATAMTALDELGVSPVLDHVAVYDLPTMRRKMILISKEKLDRAFLDNAFGPLTTNNYGQIHLLYPCGPDLQTNLINQIALHGWQHAQTQANIDLSPTTDKRPFTAQLGLMKNVHLSDLPKLTTFEYNGFPIAKMIILTVLALTALLSLPVNLLPYLRQGDTLNGQAWFYFFAIGAGFITIEIILIQQYTLSVGASAYSFAAVLLGLLISGGAGSRMAPRFQPRTVFILILALLAAGQWVLHPLAVAASSFPFVARFLLAMMFTMPIGFFMGMPFALGAAKVGEWIDWGFAVNGTATVMGSCVALLIAFNYGYPMAMAFAGVLYLFAFMVFRGMGIRRNANETPTTASALESQPN